jgi:hypothetical protein
LAKPDYDERLLDAFGIEGLSERLDIAASQINVPVLVVRGALGVAGAGGELSGYVAAFSDIEAIDVDGGGLLMAC